jgi:putative transcriptional regulator
MSAETSTPGIGAWSRAYLATILAAALAGAVEVPSTHGAAFASNPVPELHRGRVKDLAAGKFLVARRNLPDPNFHQTVVLLAQFGAEGAMGLIVNRPSTIPLSKALGTLRGSDRRSDTAYLGGPVAPTGAVALVRSRGAVTGAKHVFGDVHLITTREPLEAAIASGTKSNAFRVYLGYAGWGAAQLEYETSLGTWHVFPADPAIVFDADPDSLWDRQIRRTESLMARLNLARWLSPRASPPPL